MEGSLPNNELVRPHAHVWNTTYAFITSMSLKCAVELGVPEALHRWGRRPVPLAALAADLALPPARAPHLGRLMRMLVHAGYFACNRTDEDSGGAESGYVLTPSSTYLLSGGAAFAKVMLCPDLVMPHMHLSSWFRSGDERLPTSFHALNGEGLWEHARRVAEFNELFNAGIAHDAEMVAADVIARCASVVQGARSLVDVGGGNGSLARAFAKAFPHLKCTVLDLPHVVAAEMPPIGVTETGAGERVAYVEGNMFERIPPADVVLLKHIMHDYDDEDCKKILRQCKKAIMAAAAAAKQGKVLVIDTVVNRVEVDGAGGDNMRLVENQLLMDMEMLVVTGGKEREEKEWAKIFVESDFTGGYNIKPIMGFLSLIEVFP